MTLSDIHQAMREALAARDEELHEDGSAAAAIEWTLVWAALDQARARVERDGWDPDLAVLEAQVGCLVLAEVWVDDPDAPRERAGRT